jgi:RNA polymerase sigma factor (sigma-70 family)
VCDFVFGAGYVVNEPMQDDAELLRRYADEHSETAFAELVRRHLGLVYSVALRQVGGDPHLAEDVAQNVFTAVARKAALLVQRPALGGWLYRTTRYAAIDVVRAESRRRQREQEALMRDEPSPTDSLDREWEQLRPVLDRLIGDLAERDRDAVVLRFLENRPFAEIGRRLRLTENAARMRVERALEKLRRRLECEGVTSTRTALALALAHQAATATPGGLAATVTGSALAAAGAAGTTSALLTFLAMNKTTLGVATTLAVAAAAGVIAQQNTDARLRAEIEALRDQTRSLAEVRSEHDQLVREHGEHAQLRRDEVELETLRAEAAMLRAWLEGSFQPRRAGSAERVANVDASSADRLPEPVAPVNPVYPADLLRAGVSSEVVVGFIVDNAGVVRDSIALTDDSGPFEAAALEAVQRWSFSAGRKGGRPVNTRMQVMITFDAASGTVKVGAPAPRDAPAPKEWF